MHLIGPCHGAPLTWDRLWKATVRTDLVRYLVRPTQKTRTRSLSLLPGSLGPGLSPGEGAGGVVGFNNDTGGKRKPRKRVKVQSQRGAIHGG